jgi:hypothetical protein
MLICSTNRKVNHVCFFVMEQARGHLCQFEELVHRLGGGLLPRVVEVDAFELPGKPA